MFATLKAKSLDLLRQGLHPTRVAAAIAIGMTIGIFPIYGPVSLMGLAVVWALRLNAPITFAALYSMTFVKPVLILPFLKLGEWLFQAEPLTISLTELTRRFAADPLDTLQTFAWSFLHATVGWLVVTPVVVLAVYFISLSLVRGWKEWRTEPVAAEAPSV